MEKKVEITSSQNVVIEYTLASTIERGAGLLIDLVIMSVTALLLIACLSAAGLYTDSVQILLVIPFMLYSLLWETLSEGQSPGKKIMRIKVVKLDGSTPAFSDYALRWSMRLLDVYFSATSLGLILISTTNKSQRLGDIASNMVVIQHTPQLKKTLVEILSINSLSTYKPRYENASTLTAKEVVFIKGVLERQIKYPNSAHEDIINDLASRVRERLKLPAEKIGAKQFLNIVIKDYVVLTR